MVEWVDVVKDDYLSLQQTEAIKGALAVCVLLSHTVPGSGMVKGSILSSLIGSLGYLSVSVFFFLSGYGIMAQHRKRGEDYCRIFLKNRVLSTYFLTISLIVVYGMFHLLCGRLVDWRMVINSFLIGNTIVSYGWYLQVIVLFYLIWYICYRYIHSAKMRSAMLGAMVIMYMVLAAIFFSGSTWYECSLSFLLGIGFQVHRDKFEQAILATKGRHIVGALLAFGSFAGCYIAMHINWVENSTINLSVKLAFRITSSPAFCVFVVLMMAMLKLSQCKMLRYLGSLSLGIYVFQGIPLALFHSDYLYIQNGWLYCVCVIISSFLLAWAMQPGILWVMNLPRKYGRKSDGKLLSE